jgi:hypothetical protein
MHGYSYLESLEKAVEIRDAVVADYWKQHDRPFPSRTAHHKALKKALESQGFNLKKATYDYAGNCNICGECGRCPGYHTLEEVRYYMESQAKAQAALFA